MLCALPVNTSAQVNAERLYEQAKKLAGTDIHKATKLIEKYMMLGIETNNSDILAKSDYLYGLLNYYKSRYYISNKYYSKALRSEYARRSTAFAERCWNNMGINYEIQNLIPESLNAYHKSLALAEKMKDSVSIGQSWINLGLLNAKTENNAKAQQILTKALNFFMARKDTLNIALCYQNLCYVLSQQGLHHEAINYTLKAHAMHQAMGDEFGMASDYYNLGYDYAALNMVETEMKYLDKALKMANNQDREGLIAKIYTRYAEDYTEIGKYAEAEKYLKDALVLVHKSGAIEHEQYVYESLECLYAKNGDFDAYTETVIKRRERMKKNFLQESVARFDELQALYEFQQKTEKIKDQEKDITTKRMQLWGLTVFIVVILVILAVLTFMYLKMRRYMRSLFENKVQETQTKAAMEGNIPEDVSDHDHLQQIYTQLLLLLNDKQWQRKKLNIAEISTRLGTTEAAIYKAVSMYGKKDYNTFLDTFYIDGICKMMIENGKKTPLKQIAADSPFENIPVFSRKFKEITGLTPIQFMDYSEEKLQAERKKTIAS